jgi:PAS domain-containing protein
VAAERELAAHVLEGVGDGIFLLDDSGVVQLWNRAAELVTGLRAEAVRGGVLAEVLPDWPVLAGFGVLALLLPQSHACRGPQFQRLGLLPVVHIGGLVEWKGILRFRPLSIKAG